MALDASAMSPGLMPEPSSVTSTRSVPPPTSARERFARRVEAVLDQFLERTGRPLDDLARGDAVDEVRRQPSY
jgi:hypothetical protein